MTRSFVAPLRAAFAASARSITLAARFRPISERAAHSLVPPPAVRGPWSLPLRS